MSSEPVGFHAAEIAVQTRAGVSDERRRKAAAAIRPAMPEQHRLFFESLPVLFLGLVDGHGRPWATLALGRAGFARSPDPGQLQVGAEPVLANELGLVTRVGARIGVLGIELPTRRRNRLNGTIVRCLDDGGVVVEVDQSFGNCPQYIQTRVFDADVEDRRTASARVLDGLSPAARTIIDAADTFLIASRAAELGGGPNAGLDVSHRGGRPGFLHANGDGSLSFPDFAGNRFFNTLGNIADDGRVGLLIPQFETGHALYLTGRASIDWGSQRVTRFAGAERIVDVKPEAIRLVRNALPATATFVEASPRLAGTGTWRDVLAPSPA